MATSVSDPKEYQISISKFVGLNQSIEENDISFEYAVSAKNANTETGLLRPCKGVALAMAAPEGMAIKSVMVYHHDNNNGSTTQHILAAMEGETGCDVMRWTGTAWVSIKGTQTVSNALFDALTYLAGSTSMIIMGNGADDLYKWTGEGTLEKLFYSSADSHAPRGSAMTLHYERLWITGVSTNPESLFYSDDMNPAGWTSGTDAAGEIQLLTYTGDRFIAIRTIMDDVVAFKARSVHRIVGTYPGEYQAVQVYTSEGAIAPRSICTGNGAAFFLSADGIYTYSGTTADRLQPKVLYTLYNSINKAAVKNACGTVYRNKLYMAMPTGAETENRTVVIFDLDTGAFMTMRLPAGMGVTAWAETSTGLCFAAQNGIYEMYSGSNYAGTNIDMEWITPVSDLGSRNTDKRISTVYITGQGGQLEIKAKADARSKTKTVTLPNDMTVKRLRFSVHGRRIGLELRNVQGSSPIVSGISIIYEQNED